MDQVGDKTAVTDSLRASWITAAALAALVGIASWWRHQAFWTGFDLAIFDQAAWQLSHGRTQISIVDRHVLADHFSPVILVFGAFYRLAATPAWLFGAQALAVGGTVLAGRRMAVAVGANPRLGVALSAASSPVLSAALFDFHPSTLAVPFVAWTIVFALEGRPLPTAATALAVVACRADLALVLAAAALVARRSVRIPLLAIAVVAAAVATIVPGLFGPTNGWSPHFGHLGGSPVAAILQPWRSIEYLVTTGSLWALIVWVLAAGCLVVSSPRWMAALMLAGLPVLLSSWEGTRLPWYHYGAPMAPLAIGGTLAATRNRWAESGLSPRLLVLGPLLALSLASPLSPGAPPQNRLWAIPGGNDPETLSDLIDRVPGRAAVSAEQWFLPHLSHRRELLLFPMPFAEPDGFFAPGSVPPLGQYRAPEVLIVPAEGRQVVPDSYDLVVERAGWLLYQLP